MDALRDNHSKAEDSFKAARKKYGDESTLLNELNVKFTNADIIRQEAYSHLQTLRKQWSEKNKHFRDYKDDAKAADGYAMAGEKDNLEHHCVNQVEKIMELWNKNDEFRKEYIRCNMRSTLRRFRTLDGRSLGPDEEPPPLPIFSDNRVNALAKINSVAKVTTMDKSLPIEAKKIAQDKSSKEVVEHKSKVTSIAKNMGESSSNNNLAEVSGRIEIEEEKEERKPTKEEEESARKAEQLRREEEAVRLREQRKLEEKTKAQEALERKKRMAEKAQARAEFKARKEAEEKEKEREKRAKKKEKKKGLTSETTEGEPAPLPEPSSETVREPEVTNKPLTVAKKSHKSLLHTKHIKTTKYIPPPLRNRGNKRRMQQWMWLLITVVVVLALFFLGNSKFFWNNMISSFRPAY